MSNHYYKKNNLTLESKPQYISFVFGDKNLKFKTDVGVFSKERVDFGTTVLLGNFYQENEPQNIIDVGCGYGVIGITLASLYKNSSITMVDINDRAVKLSNENAKINNIINAKAYESYLFDEIDCIKVDVILSNPPIRAGKKVVFDIIEQSYTKLRDGGELWYVIQKKQGAASSIKKMEEIYSKVETITNKKGYLVIKATK